MRIVGFLILVSFQTKILKSNSPEDSVRENELKIEHGSAVSPPLSFRGPELNLKFTANSDLKVDQSVKMPSYRPSMGVARAYLCAPNVT